MNDRLVRVTRGGASGDDGIAMIATLVTIIILGVMAVIMFNTLGGSSGTGTTTSIPGVTVTTAPTTPENGAQDAAVASCHANYLAIETALAEYRALNGSSPPAGTAWAMAKANGGPFLQAWPESTTYYSITWNGVELSVVPVRGAASHGNDGTSTPKTGCFAA